jgi:translation initiation factor 1 (eIF-1/SUI1)
MLIVRTYKHRRNHVLKVGGTIMNHVLKVGGDHNDKVRGPLKSWGDASRGSHRVVAPMTV